MAEQLLQNFCKIDRTTARTEQRASYERDGSDGAGATATQLEDVANRASHPCRARSAALDSLDVSWQPPHQVLALASASPLATNTRDDLGSRPAVSGSD